MLPADWNKRLVDLKRAELRDEDLAWADYVFISGMIVQRESAREADRALPRGGREDRGGRAALHPRAGSVSKTSSITSS